MKNTVLNNKKKKVSEIKRLDYIAIGIGVVGLIFLFAFPIVATQKHFGYDFTNTGQIGDTVGGLTAPIIGFFSTLLIYFSFRAQIKANYIVQSQIDDQKKEDELKSLMEIYKEIKESLQDFTFDPDIEIKGRPAISNFLFYKKSPSLFLGENEFAYPNIFDRILDLIKILISKLKASKENGINIELILTLLDYQFNHYIWELIPILIQKKPEDKNIIYKYKVINEIREEISKLYLP